MNNTESDSKRINGSVYAIICFAAYTAVYYARINFSLATPYFKLQGILEENQIGTISSIFLVIYAIGRVFNGALCDKSSPRIILLTGCFVIGSTNLLMGIIPNFYVYCILWAFNAYAQSMLWGAILKTICFNYPEKTKQTKVISLIGSTLCVGNVLIIGSQSLFVETLGLPFRSLFIIPGIFAFLVALTTLIVFKEQQIPVKTKSSGLPSLKFFARSKVLKMSVPAFFHGVLKDNLTLWIPLFFSQRFLIDTSKIPLFVLAVPLIGMIARLIYPILYKLAGYKMPRLASASMGICVISSIVLTLEATGPFLASIMLCLISGAIQIANNSLLGIFPTEFSEEGKTSEASGWMDLATYSGAAIGSKVYGLIIGSVGFATMFMSWAVLALIATAGFVFYGKTEK